MNETTRMNCGIVGKRHMQYFFEMFSVPLMKHCELRIEKNWLWEQTNLKKSKSVDPVILSFLKSLIHYEPDWVVILYYAL